jgi:hypothetical protein
MPGFDCSPAHGMPSRCCLPAFLRVIPGVLACSKASSKPAGQCWRRALPPQCLGQLQARGGFVATSLPQSSSGQAVLAPSVRHLRQRVRQMVGATIPCCHEAVFCTWLHLRVGKLLAPQKQFA